MITVVTDTNFDRTLIENELYNLNPTYETKSAHNFGASYISVIELIVVPLLVTTSYDLLKHALKQLLAVPDVQEECRIIITCEQKRIIIEDSIIETTKSDIQFNSIEDALIFLKDEI